MISMSDILNEILLFRFKGCTLSLESKRKVTRCEIHKYNEIISATSELIYPIVSKVNELNFLKKY